MLRDLSCVSSQIPVWPVNSCCCLDSSTRLLALEHFHTNTHWHLHTHAALVSAIVCVDINQLSSDLTSSYIGAKVKRQLIRSMQGYRVMIISCMLRVC